MSLPHSRLVCARPALAAPLPASIAMASFNAMPGNRALGSLASAAAAVDDLAAPGEDGFDACRSACCVRDEHDRHKAAVMLSVLRSVPASALE